MTTQPQLTLNSDSFSQFAPKNSSKGKWSVFQRERSDKRKRNGG